MAVAFTIAAAALTLGILAWVLRPLWRQRPLPALVAMAVLALAVGLLYRGIGTPAALEPRATEAPRAMQDAIARLEAELQRDPNQVDGLRLLARAYQQQGESAKAGARYAQAVKLAPDDADLLVEAAESRALADPARRFDDDAVAWLRNALRLQPMHQRGRWFLGIAQRQAGDHAGAVKTWEPLLAVIDATTAAALRPQIDAARRDAGLPPSPSAAAPASSGAKALTVRVEVDPALARRMPEASLFVIARIPGGRPMPVAVEKHALRTLPAEVVLDDGDGPMPTQKLSALEEVEVLARLSASGNAMRQPGDLESKPVRVALPANEPITLSLRRP